MININLRKEHNLMPKTEIQFISRVTFTEQTPDMLLERKQIDSMYEKAFLSIKDEVCSEYSQNTTTWD